MDDDFELIPQEFQNFIKEEEIEDKEIDEILALTETEGSVDEAVMERLRESSF